MSDLYGAEEILTGDQIPPLERIIEKEELYYEPSVEFENDDGILIIVDFQEEIPNKNYAKNMMHYVTSKAIEKNRHVKTYIFCRELEKSGFIEIPLNPERGFKINLLTLKNVNGDEVLDVVKEKTDKNEKLNENEILLVALIALTNLSIPVEDALLNAARLTNKINEIDELELDLIKLTHKKTATKLVSSKKQDEILEETYKMWDFYERASEISRKEDIEKAIKEEKIAIVKNMDKNNFSLEDIALAIGISKEEVEASLT